MTVFARVTGRESTELTLRYNLANLYAELGSFERAEGLLEGLESRAGSARFEQFRAAIAILRGELELHQGRPDRAAERLDACIAELERDNRPRELAEALLRRADADVAREQATLARRLLPERPEFDAARRELASLDAALAAR